MKKKARSRKPNKQKTLESYILNTISKIQERYNFNPHLGAKQISSDWDVRTHREYARFAELIRISRKMDLSFSIKFTVAGNHSSKSSVERIQPTQVYFGRIDGTNTWKIGFSKNPINRRNQLQTANQTRIHIPKNAVIDGAGRDTEQLLHRYLVRYRHPGNGGIEWFNLPSSLVKTIVRQVQSDGTDFLRKPLG